MRLPTLAAFQEAAALVHETLDPTPQIAWPLLAARTGAEVWVKHENHTPVGSFKVRGGLVFMDDLRRHGPVEGVIGATRGNHGQSNRLRRGPGSASPRPWWCRKARRRQERGDGRVRRRACDPRRGLRGRIRARTGHRGGAEPDHGPSFDERLIRGVGTYALELFTALPDLDAVYVPVGLGSGICG